MKSDTDTPEQKLARSNNGGAHVKRTWTLDDVWKDVQENNRAAGPWGALEMWRAREAA